MNKEIRISFEPQKVGKTKGNLLVQQGSEVLHSDVLDIAKDKNLTTFLNKLKKLYPAIDKGQVRKTVLAEVGRITQQTTQGQEQQAELDVRHVVSPHLFHVPGVSGLLVPMARLSSGVPQGYWRLYLQWADGKRESVELEQYLTLPNDERLWFYPKPNIPSANMISGWSATGRKKWLNGYTPQEENLFKNLTDTFNYYLEFPREEAMGHLATLSLWAILTYSYTAWSAVPYISIGGPLGSGKSRVFDVLSKIVCKPLASSNMTAACLFRTLDAQGGTLLLDEAERLRERSGEAAEMRSILLGGYKAGGKAHRLEKVGDSFKSVAFNVYGPKAIAGIKNVPAALASRCIRISMFRAGKKSPKPIRRIDENPQRWIDLSDDLHSFALAKGQQFIKASQEIIQCDGLYGRDMEVWQPILALAKMVQDSGAIGLLDLVREHAKKSVALISDDTIPESDEILLCLLKELLDENPSGITASRLLEKAKEQDPTMFNVFSPRGVGEVLKRYGIKSHRRGGKRLYQPTEKQLLAIQESYGIDLGIEKTELVPVVPIVPVGGGQ
jgi:hypothetical protein